MCGIVGIVGTKPVNRSIYDALIVLQHRGQDAAGIMTDDNGTLCQRKDNGLVQDVFQQSHMLALAGKIGIGHVRYPTAGMSSSDEAQPFYVNSPYGICLGHNGNLTNTEELQALLVKQDKRHLNTGSDTEALLNVFAHELQRQGNGSLVPEAVFNAVRGVHERCNGGYAVIAMIMGHGNVEFRVPHDIMPIIFDKPGTLTEGKPAISHIHAFSGTEQDVLRTAAAVQQGSEHPLARAMLERAEELKISLPEVTEFQSHTGLGVSATIENQAVVCGNLEMLQERGIEPIEPERAHDLEAQANTVVWLAVSGRVIGLIAIADLLRPEAIDAVEALRRLGTHTLMLSGDAERVAAHVGREVGVDKSLGQVKPDQKAQAVEELRTQNYIVGMIGGGINDAPALDGHRDRYCNGNGRHHADAPGSATRGRRDFGKPRNFPQDQAEPVLGLRLQRRRYPAGCSGYTDTDSGRCGNGTEQRQRRQQLFTTTQLAPEIYKIKWSKQQ